VEDDGRPTTFKIRYMVDTHKLLRVSRMKDHHLSKEMEDEVIDYLNMFSSKIEGIIVNDFSYGMITPKILEHISVLAEKYNLKLFGDVQSSSQIGNVSKFHNYYLLTPTEKEARIALDDRYSGIEFIGTNLIKKTNAKNLVLTLSSEGFVSFQRTENEFYLKSQHFPALNPTPIDVVGAGDSLLTGMAVSSCAGADLMEASAIGAVVASIAVNKIGNVPITLDEVKEILGSISSWT
jgi:rfaE bifunctional protein kinase chain/domain